MKTSMNKNHPLYRQDLENIAATPGIEKLYGKSMLVTGATGLIGTLLIDALMLLNRRGAHVTVLAAGRDKRRMHERFGEYKGDARLQLLEQDVTQPFPQDLHPDVILPLASNTHPLAYSQHPVETMYINLKGAEHALELARRCGASVLYPSTVEVYGNARGGDVFTEDYTGTLNLGSSRAGYTESKRSCEALCLSYMDEYGVTVKTARLSRVFGPSVKDTDTKASSQFIQKALAGEDIVLKSKGDQYYSYTYVADAVSALLFILVHGEAGRAYNVANEMCNVHLKDFAKACADAAGTQVVYELPSEVERKGYSVATTAILDNGRLKSLGWMPRYSFADAVRRTIQIMKG